MYKYTFKSSDIGLTKESIYKGLGYSTELSSLLVDDIIENYLNESVNFLDLRGGFKIIPHEIFKVGKDFFSIGSEIFNAGKIISGYLKKAESAAIFVVTAGSGVEKLSRKLNSLGDFVAGFVVDTIGSEAAEQTSVKLEEKLFSIIKTKGFNATNKLSPGYCQWSVAEQKKLFSFFPDSFLGINLTESCLMTPIKSISGIIGIGTDVIKKDYVCSICDLENCYRRKTNG